MSTLSGVCRFALVGLTLAVGACGGTGWGSGAGVSFMAGSNVGAARIDRSLLSVMPCLGDAIRTTFSTLPASDASYWKLEPTGQPHLKQKLIVYLDPSESEAPRPDSRRIVYEIFHEKTNVVGIRYRADVPKALQQEWMAQAFLPLEQCGAIRR